MKVLSRHLIAGFAKTFVVCEGVFLFIYLMVDFLQKVDNFIEARVAEGLVGLYFLYKAPFVAVHMAPPATAIAVIVLFSLMRKNNEITALKASGVNLYSISQTLALAAFGVAVLTFLISELVVPVTSAKVNRIWNKDVEKRDPGLFYGSNQIWYKGSDWIYWIPHFDSRKQVMADPVFYFFDRAFRLVKIVEGRRGIWTDGRWQLEEVVVQEAVDEGRYKVTRQDRLYLEIPETPESFVKGLKKPEEMSYWQLKRYAEAVGQEGYDNARYLVDMNIKISFPFIILVLGILGIPIALGLKKGGVPVAASIGVGVCFVYLLTLGLFRSLGLMGSLPPMVAAWLTNVLFLFVGFHLMMRMER
ncbi:MAG: LptF/LptG family permease [Thermodesulfobacteriota bacterium]